MDSIIATIIAILGFFVSQRLKDGIEEYLLTPMYVLTAIFVLCVMRIFAYAIDEAMAACGLNSLITYLPMTSAEAFFFLVSLYVILTLCACFKLRCIVNIRYQTQKEKCDHVISWFEYCYCSCLCLILIWIWYFFHKVTG